MPDFSPRDLTALFLFCLCASLGLPAASASDKNGPRAYDLEQLGDYERRAVLRVLAYRDLRIVSDPENRPIRRIRIATLPVFSSRDGYLQWLNRLHATTRPKVVRREVLLERGDPWSRELAAETERNLQDLAFSSVAVVLPVTSRDQPDAHDRDDSERPVDALVVTRDLWSLRINTVFEYQNGTLSELSLQLSETNFLGRRKQVAANFDMNQGSYSFSPSYLDPNLDGTHWQLYATGGPVFTRDTGQFEGSFGEFQLAYPIWNLNQDWGMQLSLTHADRVVRRFVGNSLRIYDAPDTSEVEAMPQRYHLTDIDVSARGTYAFGEAIRHEVSAGYRVSYQQPRLTDGFEYSEAAEQAFRADIMPRDETLSGPLAAYHLFRPTYVTYRNIDTYDLPETLRTGPFLTVEVAPALRAFGSDRTLAQWSSRAGYRLDIVEEAFTLVELTGQGRLDDRGWYDILATGGLKVAGPKVGELFRPVGRAGAAMLVDDGQNRLLTAGGLTGLRGYRIGALAGSRRMQFNVEIRSLPVELATVHLGAVAFWDAASVDTRWNASALYHDIGAGLRLLIPQANTVPLRADWAFPITNEGVELPGRLSIGFGQAF